MFGNTKHRWFFLVFLLGTVFCSSCYFSRGKDQAYLRQWSHTKRDLEKQILKNPNDYVANYKLGVGYASKGERIIILDNGENFFFRKAILYLKKAIRIKPESAEAHFALGTVLETDNISEGAGAIKHFIFAKKLFKRQNNTESVVLAESKLRVLSKKYFSFYLLGFADIQIPEPSQPSSSE